MSLASCVIERVIARTGVMSSVMTLMPGPTVKSQIPTSVLVYHVLDKES